MWRVAQYDFLAFQKNGMVVEVKHLHLWRDLLGKQEMFDLNLKLQLHFCAR